MPKFDDYTQKTTPEDNDIALILDKTANVNKKTPFSGVWNWIVSKLTSAVISQLETTNKSIVPAINELNSNSYKRLNYVRNSDVKTYINSQIKNKNFAGYVLFSECTGLPEGNESGVILYYNANGTSNVYMEYLLESNRYYGWYNSTADTDIIWKSYKF